MESTAFYHSSLFSYLTAQGYRVIIINPLLINNSANRSLRKTKTDKKDALTIAQFLMREKETLPMARPSHLIGALEGLARRRREAHRSGDRAEERHEEDSLRHIPGT